MSGKAGRKLHILIRGNDGLHHLTQEDLSDDVPGVMALRAGDRVTARVRHDPFGRDLDWLWELRRDGVVILSYEDTYRYFERVHVADLRLAHWTGILAVGLFALAVLLRRHFGAWRDTRQLGSRGDAGSSGPLL